ncbi:MAG: flavin reductase family protein [Methylobacteriaceae bacterium]|nr:flavin reductase family protein [Methylobacteriaceae bacterium]
MDRRAALAEMSAFAHALPRDPSPGAADLLAFRRGMRALAGAVTVLATRLGDERWGLTATAICSLSAEPPRLLACINQRGASFAAFRESRLLSVNVLAENQFAVAERFAGLDGSAEDRFAAGVWRDGAVEGLPVLADAAATFECRVPELIDAGTHAILIGDILTVRSAPEARPLLYCDGRFTGVADEIFDPRYGFQF